ncbi:MAG: excinuclease ABC subunit UvrA [Ignavibacteriae bacterium]|nr:excinuclease ABC subunit UvrA [Ignavibacteriota bacterium]
MKSEIKQTKDKKRKTKNNQPDGKNIVIRGARVHNLKNISLELPRNKLIVFTGVSGSGKSSLAFDTIYAEGQRRFVESLSSYARQFLERMEKPEVDFIQGISPAIAIEQKTSTRNPRSTVGTSTEVYDYLRLLYGRIGKVFCSNCGKVVQRDSVRTVVERLNETYAGKPSTKIYVMFPVAEHPKTKMTDELARLKQQGFVRILFKNELIDVSETDFTETTSKEKVTVVVDRLTFKPGTNDSRFADSVETAFRAGEGSLIIHDVGTGNNIPFNQQFACADCGVKYEEPDPRLFSFNNPFGACPKCEGFGRSISLDLDLVIPNKNLSLEEGAIHPWTMPKWKENLNDLLKIAGDVGVRTDVPFRELSKKELDVVFNGCKGFDGIFRFFKFIESKLYKVHYRVFLSRFRRYTTCDTCGGSRLRPAALNVFVGEKSIGEIVRLPIEEARKFFEQIQLSEYETEVAKRILDELKRRLTYLDEIGIGYLTLDRLSNTLSGGESQRINLSTALGSSLVGSLYVLDEPSIGLHPRDTQRLVNIMKSLRDVGNTVLVVEHDSDIMNSADYIVDMGPAAGELGGEIVFEGSPDKLSSSKTLTAKYLRGELNISVPTERRTKKAESIKVRNAMAHNLKSIDIEIPLKKFVCVTGVSGSGKSTLVHEIVFPSIKAMKESGSELAGVKGTVEGAHHVDAVELVDQSPIGKTPRSNPATYIGAYDVIREVFANTQASKIRGFKPGSFSFNVPGGRCDTCEGSGIQTIEMQFLADLELTCESCNGKRFKKEILAVHYHDKNIDDVLNMTVSDAILFFRQQQTGRKIVQRLQVLEDVGMGYIRLGQSATTLSGGEAQRVKLAAHLAEQQQGKHTLYIFDEPTTGLHFDDIVKLLRCFNALLEKGNSLLIIEHNMEVIKCADWILDLGPEAGDRGGEVVVAGTPETVAKCEKSFTGVFLRKYL